MIVKTERVWLIMSKNREWVAKGTPRNRCLVKVNDTKDKKRYLTYTSEGRANAAFGGYLGFYSPVAYDKDNPNHELEAVEVEMVIREIEK